MSTAKKLVIDSLHQEVKNAEMEKNNELRMALTNKFMEVSQANLTLELKLDDSFIIRKPDYYHAGYMPPMLPPSHAMTYNGGMDYGKGGNYGKGNGYRGGRHDHHGYNHDDHYSGSYSGNKPHYIRQFKKPEHDVRVKGTPLVVKPLEEKTYKAFFALIAEKGEFGDNFEKASFYKNGPKSENLYQALHYMYHNQGLRQESLDELIKEAESSEA